jgi:1-acyl-sn-glycerol-3-phosphate acyltransferase
MLRHASVGDTLLASVFVQKPHHMRCRYVLKRELLWDPCIDIVGNRLANYFVRRYSEDSAREIAAVRRLVEDLEPGESFLIYPEGTRFTPAKRARILERLREHGDPGLLARAERLTRLLPPRLGGTLEVLDANPGADVVICAHTGFESVATFWDLWSGAPIGREIHVEFWRIPWAEVPKDRSQRIDWLFEQWTRIDAWIAAHSPSDSSRT